MWLPNQNQNQTEILGDVTSGQAPALQVGGHELDFQHFIHAKCDPSSTATGSPGATQGSFAAHYSQKSLTRTINSGSTFTLITRKTNRKGREVREGERI